VKIELDSYTNIITVDGVKISLEILKTLANPSYDKYYQFARSGDVVWITESTRPPFKTDERGW
jgi:hypothetical protein